MLSIWFAVALLVMTGWLTGLTIGCLWLRRKSLSRPPAMLGGGLRYWSLQRFNPFADVGGHESFVLVLLDEQKNGIVLTNLHGRGVSRFYAKQMTNGQCEQELSDEEKVAVRRALST